MENRKFKPGDIVLCIDTNFVIDDLTPFVKEFPSFMEIYTIREIFDEDAVRLEEIINPVIIKDSHNYGEPSFYMWHFIKLEDPQTLEIEYEVEAYNSTHL